MVETERVVEVEVEDATDFRDRLQANYEEGVALLWFTDTKGRQVAIPRDKVAYVEFEGDPERHRVGFSPGI